MYGGLGVNNQCVGDRMAGDEKPFRGFIRAVTNVRRKLSEIPKELRVQRGGRLGGGVTMSFSSMAVDSPRGNSGSEDMLKTAFGFCTDGDIIVRRRTRVECAGRDAVGGAGQRDFPYCYDANRRRQRLPLRARVSLGRRAAPASGLTARKSRVWPRPFFRR